MRAALLPPALFLYSLSNPPPHSATDYAMDGDHHSEPPPAAAPLHAMNATDDQQPGANNSNLDYLQTEVEGGDDDEEYGAAAGGGSGMMDEDEAAEQESAQRLREELKQKRLVSAGCDDNMWVELA